MSDNPINTTAYEVFDNTLDEMQASADMIAGYILKDTNLTEEGKVAEMQRKTAEHREHLEHLEKHVYDFEADAERQVEKARESILPTPQGDTGTLAAELQAQRIMSRPGMDDVSNVMQWIQGTPPSPARTLVIEEMQARGVIGTGQVDAMLQGTHDEYRAALRGLNVTRDMVNHAYRGKIAALRRRLDNPHAQGRDLTEQHDYTLWKDLLPGTKYVEPVRRWVPNNSERSYRAFENTRYR